jgi:hypothetical protein
MDPWPPAAPATGYELDFFAGFLRQWPFTLTPSLRV